MRAAIAFGILVALASAAGDLPCGVENSCDPHDDSVLLQAASAKRDGCSSCRAMSPPQTCYVQSWGQPCFIPAEGESGCSKFGGVSCSVPVVPTPPPSSGCDACRAMSPAQACYVSGWAAPCFSPGEGEAGCSKFDGEWCAPVTKPTTDWMEVDNGMGISCDQLGAASDYNFESTGNKFCTSTDCQLGPYSCSGNGWPAPVVTSGGGSPACDFFRSGQDTTVDGQPAKKSYGHIIKDGTFGVCYAVKSKVGNKNIVVIMGIDLGCLNVCAAGQSPELGCFEHEYLRAGSTLQDVDRIPIVPCPGVSTDTSTNCGR
mmetsp:Transcript_102367/g.293699  ORF Transcript_102367/g.293699 Transcript_102367/m.293699 type:complete len:315 (-) Transcript_102367:170-1114(-)